MTRKDIIASIDLGSKYVRCVVAEVADNAPIEILGVGKALTKGIHKGLINNINEASKSIEEAVKETEKQAGFSIKHAYVSLGGIYVTTKMTNGALIITSSDKIITENDVRKVKDNIRSMCNTPGETVIQAIPFDFTVDSFAGVENPIGMSGDQLELTAMVVSVRETHLANIIKAIENAGIEIEDDGIALSGYCAALATLSEEMKELGAIIIDIGHDSTSVTVYRNKSVALYKSIKIGGYRITSDISQVFGITLGEAERLKISKGTAWSDLIAEDEELSVSSIASSEQITISLKDLTGVIEARLEDIFKKLDINSNSFIKNHPVGLIVLTGASSAIPGADLLCKDFFNRPVKIGEVIAPQNIPEEFSDAQYATVMGTILYGANKMERITDKPPSKSPVLGFLDNIMRVLHEIF